MGKRRAGGTRGLGAEKASRTTQSRAASSRPQAPRARSAPGDGLLAEALPALFRVDAAGELVPLNGRAAALRAQTGATGEQVVARTGKAAIDSGRRRLHSEPLGHARRLMVLAEPAGKGRAQVIALSLTWGIDVDGEEGRLTPREREVLRLLVSGLSLAEIADSLRIRPNTVRTYLKSLHRVFRVSSRVELVAGLLQAVRPQLDDLDAHDGQAPAGEPATPARARARRGGRSSR